jgi:antitoxin ParD1/3/4
MATRDVSIPENMKLWVERQTNSGGFANANNYMRHLILRDQERAAKIAHIQALVSQGIESGVGLRSMDASKTYPRVILADRINLATSRYIAARLKRTSSLYVCGALRWHCRRAS